MPSFVLLPEMSVLNTLVAYFSSVHGSHSTWPSIVNDVSYGASPLTDHYFPVLLEGIHVTLLIIQKVGLPEDRPHFVPLSLGHGRILGTQ